MGEIKQTNIRIDSDTANAFRAFCDEQGFNQAQGFDHIMEILALSQAKQMVSGRIVEIEEFERHAKALVSSYITSLELTQNTELRVREDFQGLLTSKDEQIVLLQKKIETLKNEISDLKNEAIETKKTLDIATAKERTAFDRMLAAEQSSKDKAAIADMLTSKLAEAEDKLSEYPALMENCRNLKEKLSETEQALKDLKNEATAERERVLAATEIEKEKISAEKDRKIAEIELNAQKNLMALEKEKNAEIQQLRDKIDTLKDKLISPEFYNERIAGEAASQDPQNPSQSRNE